MTQHIDLSLSEVFTLTKHAAQGVHCPFPEEVARCAVWLVKYDFLAADLLLHLLKMYSLGGVQRTLSPQDLCHRQSLPFCAVHVGCYLADNVNNNMALPMHLPNLAAAAFILPYVQYIAAVIKQPIEIEFTHIKVQTDGCDVYANNIARQGRAKEMTQVSLSICHAISLPKLEVTSRAVLQKRQFAEIKTHATKIYAPATEQSRLRGAG